MDDWGEAAFQQVLAAITAYAAGQRLEAAQALEAVEDYDAALPYACWVAAMLMRASPSGQDDLQALAAAAAANRLDIDQ